MLSCEFHWSFIDAWFIGQIPSTIVFSISSAFQHICQFALGTCSNTRQYLALKVRSALQVSFSWSLSPASDNSQCYLNRTSAMCPNDTTGCVNSARFEAYFPVPRTQQPYKQVRPAIASTLPQDLYRSRISRMCTQCIYRSRRQYNIVTFSHNCCRPRDRRTLINGCGLQLHRIHRKSFSNS